MPYRAALVPLNGDPPFEVTQDVVLVGRKSDCDLRLEHKAISKHHCVVVKTDGLLVLRDLGSTNGTRVNNTRVRRAALLPKDKVSFGHFHYQVHLGPADAPIPALEKTQAFSADDLPKDDSDTDAKEEKTPARVVRNELPDVYPGDERKK